MSHAPTSSDRSSGQGDDRPALGSRQNFWGDDADNQDDEENGHSEEAGTDEAEHLARRYVFTTSPTAALLGALIAAVVLTVLYYLGVRVDVYARGGRP